MKAKATAVGFYGGSLRQPGEVFVVESDFKASWATPVDQPPEKPADKPKGKAPEKPADKPV